MSEILHVLLILCLGQSLAVLSNGQRDLSNVPNKYNGPSHQYLPVEVYTKESLPSTRDSLQDYQFPPLFKDFSQQTQSFQSKVANESRNSQNFPAYTEDFSQSQQSGVGAVIVNEHLKIDPAGYQNLDHSKKFSDDSYKISDTPLRPFSSTFQQRGQQQFEYYNRPSGIFDIPPITTLTQSPPASFTSRHYQESKPPRKSQLYFIIPETTTVSSTLNREVPNKSKGIQSAKNPKDLQHPTQQYLPPFPEVINFQSSQNSVESTTTYSPKFTSKYLEPNHQYLPGTTKAPPKVTSLPYTATISQSSVIQSNNGPWKPIKTENPKFTKRTKIRPSVLSLPEGYRYNIPAQSHPSPNFHNVNDVNYNELGMGVNSTIANQTVNESYPNSEAKTEIETQQGYVYGHHESSSESDIQVITQLKSIPTDPYHAAGQRFEINSNDHQQKQLESKEVESPLNRTYLGERLPTTPAEYKPESETNSLPNMNKLPDFNLNSNQSQNKQDHDGGIGPDSEAPEQHGPTQYKKNSGSNSNLYEKVSTESFTNQNPFPFLQKPMKNLRPISKGYNEYKTGQQEGPKIRSGYNPDNPQDQLEYTNHNIPQTIQISEKNLRSLTGYTGQYVPSSGANCSDHQQLLYSNIPAVNTDSIKSLNSKTFENITPFVLNSSKQIDLNRNYDMPTNYGKNLRPLSGALTESRPSNLELYGQAHSQPEANQYLTPKYIHSQTEILQTTKADLRPSGKASSEQSPSNRNSSVLENSRPSGGSSVFGQHFRTGFIPSNPKNIHPNRNYKLATNQQENSKLLSRLADENQLSGLQLHGQSQKETEAQQENSSINPLPRSETFLSAKENSRPLSQAWSENPPFGSGSYGQKKTETSNNQFHPSIYLPPRLEILQTTKENSGTDQYEQQNKSDLNQYYPTKYLHAGLKTSQSKNFGINPSSNDATSPTISSNLEPRTFLETQGFNFLFKPSSMDSQKFSPSPQDSQPRLHTLTNHPQILNQNTPSSNPAIPKSLPFFTTKPNLQSVSHYEPLSFQGNQGNNLSSKPISMYAEKMSPTPQYSHLWLPTQANSPQLLSQMPDIFNTSPISQEYLQTYSTTKPVSPIPVDLLPPKFSKTEYNQNFPAVQTELTSANDKILNQGLLNSYPFQLPISDIYRNPISNQKVAYFPSQTSSSLNNQGQFTQSVNKFTSLQTSAKHMTFDVTKPQQFDDLNQQELTSDDNPSWRESSILQRDPSLSHTVSEKLNINQPENSQTNSTKNLVYQNRQQFPSLLSLKTEIHRPSLKSPPSLSFQSNNDPINLKTSLQSQTAPIFTQTQRNLDESSHFSSDFQGYTPNPNENLFSSATSSLSKIGFQNQAGFLHPGVTENQSTAKQFELKNGSGTSSINHEQHQFFLGHPSTTSQIPSTSSVRNFFGPSNNISNAASNTNSIDSYLRPIETASGSSKFNTSLQSHLKGSYFTTAI